MTWLVLSRLRHALVHCQSEPPILVKLEILMRNLFASMLALLALPALAADPGTLPEPSSLALVGIAAVAAVVVALRKKK